MLTGSSSTWTGSIPSSEDPEVTQPQVNTFVGTVGIPLGAGGVVSVIVIILVIVVLSIIVVW